MKAIDAIHLLQAGKCTGIRRRCWHRTRWLIKDQGKVYLYADGLGRFGYIVHSIDVDATDWVALGAAAVA